MGAEEGDGMHPPQVQRQAAEEEVRPVRLRRAGCPGQLLVEPASVDQREDDARSMVWEWPGDEEVLLGHPVARTFEQHHQRDLVAQRELGKPIALRVAAGSDARNQV